MSKEPKRNMYVGHRYVPLVIGEWEKTETYEGLSIVTNKGTSYTSKKRVPKGIDILNEEYWVVTGNYNAQIEEYRKDVRELEKDLNDLETDVNVNIDGFKTDVTNDMNEFKETTNNKITKVETDTTEAIEKNTEQLDQISINVKSLGAKGDGITDDTNYIREAVTMLENGGSILFPEGKYLISEQIEIPYDSITIEGNGATLLKPNNEFWLFRGVGCSKILVRNLNFILGKTGGAFNGNINDFIFEKNNVEGGAPAIFLRGLNDDFIENLTVRDNVYLGNGVGSFFAFSIARNILVDNNVGSNGSEFVDSNNNCEDVTFINNKTTDFTDNHYDLNSTKNALVYNNVLRQTVPTKRPLLVTDDTSVNPIYYSDNITFDSNNIIFDTVPSEYVFAIISGIIVDVPHTPIFKFTNNTIEVGEIGGRVFFGNSDNVDFIVSNNKFKNIRRIVFSKGKQTVVGNVVEKGQLRCDNLKNSFIGYNNIIDGNPEDNTLEGSLFSNNNKNSAFVFNTIINTEEKQTGIGSSDGGTNKYVYTNAINAITTNRVNDGDVNIDYEQ